MKKITLISLVLAICFCSTSFAAIAEIYIFGFDYIVNPADGIVPENGQIGQQQIFMDVSLLSDNQVSFNIRNTGLDYFTIDAIHFSDPSSLFQDAHLVDAVSGGDNRVQFDQKNNGNLPKADSLGGFDSDWVFEALPRGRSNVARPFFPGIEPDQQLGIIMNFDPSVTIASLVDSMVSGQTQIGIHAQRFDNGSSATFVNQANYMSTVPEPATIALFSLGAVLFLRRKKLR